MAGYVAIRSQHALPELTRVETEVRGVRLDLQRSLQCR